MFFKKFSNKLLIILFLISIFSIPNMVLAYTNKVILGGQNLGIEINSKGVLIVGFYSISGISPGKDANLKIGDIIIKIDDTVIDRITDLTNATKVDNEIITLTYIRNNKTYNTELKLYKDKDNVYKTGLYVKDSIIGIGTLTFIDPTTLQFAALGHEIIEKTTGQRFEIKNGLIFKSTITSITKSTRSSPGEKNANYDINTEYGIIEKNNLTGIYGKYTEKINNNDLILVAKDEEIELGEAYIKTVINGKKIETFTIEIIKIYPTNETKNILFKVTDKTLLEKTGGIVQGMSGSPIIQNNKLIGAVTHVVSDDSTTGFGIFISAMLKEIED